MQVVFRPNYCVNCGEKIIRDQWHLWTSGRFCEVCETEFQGRELLWKAAAAFAVLCVAAVGFAFVAPERRAETKLVAATSQIAAPKAILSRTEPPKRPVEKASENAVTQRDRAAPASDPVKPQTVVAEPVYICGAETKKGTPCSRKVKGNVRCWQHQGMPAMLKSEDLRVR